MSQGGAARELVWHRGEVIFLQGQQGQVCHTPDCCGEVSDVVFCESQFLEGGEGGEDFFGYRSEFVVVEEEFGEVGEEAELGGEL